MKMQTYTLGHGPAEVVTVVEIPAFSTPKGVTMDLALNRLRVSVMVPAQADAVQEMFVTYADGFDIQRHENIDYMGSCADLMGGVWHVFHVPPRYARFFVPSPSESPSALETFTELTLEHIVDVCKRGQGEACCRYLMTGPEGWCCARAKGPGWVDMLDERVKSGTIRSRGSNCGGCQGSVPI